MADYEPPSFSLGLDLCHDSEPQITDLCHSAQKLVPNNEEELGPQVIDSDPEMGPEPPTQILKRLKRGPSAGLSSAKKKEEPQSCCDGDDDIEDFSSQDDLIEVNMHLSTQKHSVCSSSKISLNGSGVLTTQSSSQWKERKRKQVSDLPASDRLETGCKNLMFPKLTSPLRRFQLIDSDSDDPSFSEDVSREAHKIGSPLKKQKNFPGNFVASMGQNRRESTSRPQNEDLWKDFCQMKNSRIPTPALDEVCEEYFHSPAQRPGIGVSVSNKESFHGTTDSFQNDEQLWDSSNPLPPAHLYFFHDDPRIGKLVRDRLPNFSPLGVVNRMNQWPNASIIDYMGQFSNGEASKRQGTQKSCVEKGSTRDRNKSEVSNVGGWVEPKNIYPLINGESSKQKPTKRNSFKKSSVKGKNISDQSNSVRNLYASESWVEPQSCANMPKDAGKRRVQASGQSVGHWYTASDGKKVYVSRSGQDLTGQSAYRHYRKWIAV
ncbi:Rho GTPase-activating protein [Quillaja saponaria]|uniref:Rho GTPase-activating protein n=1 Tax=Quillaja saponaria TaxID=32244 RepID=A0AAD7LT26_QUISA|nr:Rho GTPase-activating protein [Quillaja saponaria]